jgi:hypothetical protein
MPPVGQDQFVDRQPGFLIALQPAAGSKPLGNQPVIFGDAGLGFVRPEVVIYPAQSDDGLATGFVLAVLRHTADGFWHWRSS